MVIESSTLTHIGDLTEEGTSKTVEAAGMQVHYHDVGTGEPLIMLHSGGPGTTAWLTFFKTLPALSKHFRCIAVDLPNFAKSGPAVFSEPVHTFEARVVLRVIDALGIEKPHLLGNSEGGQACMVFAYTYPDRIDKLVWGAAHIGTADGYTAEYTFTVEPEASREFTDAASTDPTPANLRRYLEWQIRDKSLIDDELVEYIRAAHTGRPDLAVARSSSVNVPFDHIKGVMSIQAPTLLVWGRHDRTANFEIGINALNHIPNSRMVMLHCGHWVPFERPREYTSHVLNFLKGDWA
jgi:2-hydroxy-6-oxonona-2,4-dienedioate hydrolase